ncbi:phage late control D family protein [Brevibacillus brevis]|uniref:phage late control D family protein n=1 Tax=Brevibacillus brevis TaxID=1393 RepID=UPI000D10834C|nr:contractile injection system protein, VgrG/Pvc8 family [Brevibacillus brevis]PSJ67276.1 hypothetical protein C7J99_21405 [Brevibacillus brevis]RED19770.1 hypothetical protein DES34_1433 [Brevibacillus brevis]VEF87632.1 Phage protein D [Brevibacillus brevis]
MAQPRRVKFELLYDNKNISNDLQPYLISFEYTDNLSGTADTISINLADRERLWWAAWMPELYASIKAKIIRENWIDDGKTDALNCGYFEINEINLTSPPNAVSIQGVSVPDSSTIRAQRKFRAWEQTRLSVIAKDIAGKNGLKLLFDAEDEDYDRIEQTEETDLGFLMRLCDDAGIAVKLTGKQISLFDEAKYEEKPPAFSLNYATSKIKSFSAQVTTTGIYSRAVVNYHSPKGKKKIHYTYMPPNAPKTGRTLYINERVKDGRQAERKAKSALRQANKEQHKASITLMGDVNLVAGMTFMLNNFGAVSGKYIITQAVHAYSGNGYETSLECRKVLGW